MTFSKEEDNDFHSKEEIEVNILDDWQILNLNKFNNTIISQKHFDERLVKIHELLYSSKINIVTLKCNKFKDKYEKCKSYYIEEIKNIFRKDVNFVLLPGEPGTSVDCLKIELL